MSQQCRRHLGKVVSHAEQSKLDGVSSMFFFSKETIKLMYGSVVRGDVQSKINTDMNH